MFSPGDDSPELKAIRTDPNLSLRERWTQHKAHMKKTGEVGHAASLDRYGPVYFLFVTLGAMAWTTVVIQPYKHSDNVWMLLLAELVTWYLFVQVMVNWRLCQTTDSSYKPEAEDNPKQSSFEPNGSHVLNDASAVGANANVVEVDMSSNILPPTDGTGNSVLSYRVHVVTSVKDGHVQRTSFPYWSWVPCLICRRLRPPRCHHCVLCKQCVLKRDHHCYLTASCVAANNQRYFMFFLFWCVFLTNLGCYYMVPHAFTDILKHSTYWNLVPPVNFVNALRGELSLVNLHYILVVWGVVFLTLLSMGILTFYVFLTSKGLTKFEHDCGIKVVDTRSVAARFRAVMGRDWGYSLILPGYRISEPLEDPVRWPHIKVS